MNAHKKNVLTLANWQPKTQPLKPASKYIEASKAGSTRKAYKSDLKIFADWCAVNNAQSLPATPETVGEFLENQADAGIAPATLSRRLAAIKDAHEAAGHETPTNSKLVTNTLKGIKREKGAAQNKKAPVTADRLAAMLAHISADTIIGKRDRAILVLGFVGAFRRSELAALTVNDLQETEKGLQVIIRKSKTDQEGKGQTIAIPNGDKLQAVNRLRDWLDAAGITEGAIFRPITKGGSVRNVAITDKSISETVKKYAKAAGFDAADFAGHSLRSGFLTSAAESGASIFKMAEQSRHRSLQTLQAYVRSADLFKDHAGSAFV